MSALGEIMRGVFGPGGPCHSTFAPAAWPTESTARGISDYGPLPRRDADSPTRIKFLRRHVRLYAQDQAILGLAGLIDDAEIDTLLAATGIAEQCGMPYRDGIAAGRAEWASAQDRAKQFVDDLRRVVYPLSRGGSDQRRIMAAAEIVSDRYGYALPGISLSQACEAIWRSAQSRPVRRRR